MSYNINDPKVAVQKQRGEKDKKDVIIRRFRIQRQISSDMLDSQFAAEVLIELLIQESPNNATLKELSDIADKSAMQKVLENYFDTFGDFEVELNDFINPANLVRCTEQIKQAIQKQGQGQGQGHGHGQINVANFANLNNLFQNHNNNNAQQGQGTNNPPPPPPAQRPVAQQGQGTNNPPPPPPAQRPVAQQGTNNNPPPPPGTGNVPPPPPPVANNQGGNNKTPEQRATEFLQNIPNNVDYAQLHALALQYLPTVLATKVMTACRKENEKDLNSKIQQILSDVMVKEGMAPLNVPPPPAQQQGTNNLPPPPPPPCNNNRVPGKVQTPVTTLAVAQQQQQQLPPIPQINNAPKPPVTNAPPPPPAQRPVQQQQVGNQQQQGKPRDAIDVIINLLEDNTVTRQKIINGVNDLPTNDNQVQEDLTNLFNSIEDQFLPIAIDTFREDLKQNRDIRRSMQTTQDTVQLARDSQQQQQNSPRALLDALNHLVATQNDRNKLTKQAILSVVTIHATPNMKTLIEGILEGKNAKQSTEIIQSVCTNLKNTRNLNENDIGSSMMQASVAQGQGQVQAQAQNQNQNQNKKPALRVLTKNEKDKIRSIALTAMGDDGKTITNDMTAAKNSIALHDPAIRNELLKSIAMHLDDPDPKWKIVKKIFEITNEEAAPYIKRYKEEKAAREQNERRK